MVQTVIDAHRQVRKARRRVRALIQERSDIADEITDAREELRRRQQVRADRTLAALEAGVHARRIIDAVGVSKQAVYQWKGQGRR